MSPAETGQAAGPKPSTLPAAIQVWKQANFRISQNITRIAAGKKPSSEHGAFAAALHKALQARSSDFDELHRGVLLRPGDTSRAWAKPLVAALAQGPGAEVDLGATSWTKSAKVAAGFSGDDKEQVARRIVFTAVNTRGLDIQFLGGGGFEHEAEVISGGRYRIAAVAKNGKTWNVRLEHVGALG